VQARVFQSQALFGFPRSGSFEPGVDSFCHENSIYYKVMNTKSLIWIGVFVGSAVGGYIPLLWGDSMFSMTSVILSTVGGIAGIWCGWKLSQML